MNQTGINRILKRMYHSAQGQQELMLEKAADIERQIIEAMLKDEKECREIVSEILGSASTSSMVLIFRNAFRGNAEITNQLVVNEGMEQIKRIAEHRAMKHFEEFRPDWLLPD